MPFLVDLPFLDILHFITLVILWGYCMTLRANSKILSKDWFYHKSG